MHVKLDVIMEEWAIMLHELENDFLCETSCMCVDAH